MSKYSSEFKLQVVNIVLMDIIVNMMLQKNLIDK